MLKIAGGIIIAYIAIKYTMSIIFTLCLIVAMLALAYKYR
jgi:hypothetical protein